MSDPNDPSKRPATDPWAPQAPSADSAGSAWSDVQQGADQAAGQGWSGAQEAATGAAAAAAGSAEQAASGSWGATAQTPNPAPTAPAAPAAPPAGSWGATSQVPAPPAAPTGGSWGAPPVAPPPAQAWAPATAPWQAGAMAPAWAPGQTMNYAGVGTRFVAYFIDGLVAGVLFAIPFFIGAAIQNGEGLVSWLLYLLGFVLGFGYKVYFEATTGAALGKRLMNIKVVDEAGSPPGWGPSIIRNLLYIIDGLLGNLVGLVLILASDKKQRLGDMLAKTFVVKD